MKLPLDREICKGLCPKIHEEDYFLCRKICESHLSDEGELDDICPFQKQCPSGCPCPFYHCENVDTRKSPLAWFYEEGNFLFETEGNASPSESSSMNFLAASSDFPAPKARNTFSRIASVNSTSLEAQNVYDRIGNGLSLTFINRISGQFF